MGLQSSGAPGPPPLLSHTNIAVAGRGLEALIPQLSSAQSTLGQDAANPPCLARSEPTAC